MTPLITSRCSRRVYTPARLNQTPPDRSICDSLWNFSGGVWAPEVMTTASLLGCDLAIHAKININNALIHLVCLKCGGIN